MSYAYITNAGNGFSSPPEAGDTVSVLDASSYSLVDTITVGNAPTGIAITPNGNYAYLYLYDRGEDTSSFLY